MQTMADFRSDTVTRPGALMLEAMLKAKVGDDVFGEDPSINQLESMTAELFGKEAGLFCPSGTMANQIAIKVHTQPGDEVICDKLSHIYQYEGGGIAFNSGCSVKLLDGDRGRVRAEQIKEAINPDDLHKPNSSLVSLENTSNRGGGSCYNFVDIEQIKQVCLQNNLRLHLDGARLFNALIARNETPKQYGEIFDTISLCMSKGLGAPVGSVLIGEKNTIKKARRIRKVFGGGMRQAGFLAAAGIYALQNNIERLADDHAHAQLLTATLNKMDFIGNILPVETNIVIFEVSGRYTAAEFVLKLKEAGILAIAMSALQVRMVVHLDITAEMIQKTIQIIQSL
jgi:threonine aldolase